MKRDRRHWDWPGIIAACQSRPGVWMIRLVNVPYRMQRSVRDRSAPELHLPDGVIEADMRNVYRDDMGSRRGDLYLRYTPSGSLGTQVLPQEEPPHGDGQDSAGPELDEEPGTGDGVRTP